MSLKLFLATPAAINKLNRHKSPPVCPTSFKCIKISKINQLLPHFRAIWRMQSCKRFITIRCDMTKHPSVGIVWNYFVFNGKLFIELSSAESHRFYLMNGQDVWVIHISFSPQNDDPTAVTQSSGEMSGDFL